MTKEDTVVIMVGSLHEVELETDQDYSNVAYDIGDKKQDILRLGGGIVSRWCPTPFDT